ncbi:MAG: allophanate hydrolase, partial [Hyphomicrobiaceae bacterium]
MLKANLADPNAIPAGVRRCYERLRDADDPSIFISLRDIDEVMQEAESLATDHSRRGALFGIPFAVKDNIDVSGLPTTAACPAFAYRPAHDAVAVARLRQAGAIVIGKTNLDQFATGLVGVRSPYGVPRNSMRTDLVPGGSSSGSAVAVARGIVPMALGTDTAGSGRVPAGLNNVVGLKPSVGLVPTTGVVPACRSLDCVSVFALTAEDAFMTLAAMAGTDDLDGFSRALPLGPIPSLPRTVRIGIPRRQDRQFFGSTEAAAAFENAIEQIQKLGWTIVDFDLTAMFEAARLLYEGPWVAERTAAVGDFISLHAEDVLAVTRSIIMPGARATAVEAFRGQYRLAELRKSARMQLASIDALMVPTAPRAYMLADLDADPIGPNTRLGTYTNFVNLLDMAGAAVPSRILADNTPVGVTFLGVAGSDARLASIGAAYHASTGLPLGALGPNHSPPPPPRQASLVEGQIALAVAGAHLSGMPLNPDLIALGAHLLETTETTADYRLYALMRAEPPKGAILRVGEGGGKPIEVEIWALGTEAFGRLVASIPPPLSIGTVRLKDGRLVKGFLAEPEGIAGERDITRFGGWRAAFSELANTPASAIRAA